MSMIYRCVLAFFATFATTRSIAIRRDVVPAPRPTSHGALEHSGQLVVVGTVFVEPVTVCPTEIASDHRISPVRKHGKTTSPYGSSWHSFTATATTRCRTTTTTRRSRARPGRPPSEMPSSPCNTLHAITANPVATTTTTTTVTCCTACTYTTHPCQITTRISVISATAACTDTVCTCATFDKHQCPCIDCNPYNTCGSECPCAEDKLDKWRSTTIKRRYHSCGRRLYRKERKRRSPQTRRGTPVFDRLPNKTTPL